MTSFPFPANYVILPGIVFWCKRPHQYHKLSNTHFLTFTRPISHGPYTPHMKPSSITLILFSLILMIALPSDAVARKKKSGAAGIMNSETLEPDAMPACAICEAKIQKAVALNTTQAHINSRYREGIDVSHYQGWIDWDQVAGCSKISYVYLKATEGANYLDDTYARNLSEARRVGLSVGSYHFYRPNVNWQEQFRNLTENVKAETQDLVPIIDIETRGKVSEERFINDLKDFVSEVEKHYGKKPLLYSYQNFYNRHLLGHFDGYHWMIAKYQESSPVLNDGKDYIMWQYTSTGSIPGIKGNVDRSKIMGDYSLHQVQL